MNKNVERIKSLQAEIDVLEAKESQNQNMHLDEIITVLDALRRELEIELSWFEHQHGRSF